MGEVAFWFFLYFEIVSSLEGVFMLKEAVSELVKETLGKKIGILLDLWYWVDFWF